MAVKDSTKIKADLVRARQTIKKKFQKLRNDLDRNERKAIIKYNPLTNTLSNLIRDIKLNNNLHKEDIIQREHVNEDRGRITSTFNDNANIDDIILVDDDDEGGQHIHQSAIENVKPRESQRLKKKNISQKNHPYLRMSYRNKHHFTPPASKRSISSIRKQTEELEASTSKLHTSSNLMDDDNIQAGCSQKRVRSSTDENSESDDHRKQKQKTHKHDRSVSKLTPIPSTSTSDGKSVNRQEMKRNLVVRLRDVGREGVAKAIEKEKKKNMEKVREDSQNKPTPDESLMTSDSSSSSIIVISPYDYNTDGSYKGVCKKKRRKHRITKQNRKAIIRKLNIHKKALSGSDSSDGLDNHTVRKGEGLEKEFIPYTENIAYEYYDDPNEICERLRLLVMSKASGNSNHNQEINSIIEELREADIIV